MNKTATTHIAVRKPGANDERSLPGPMAHQQDTNFSKSRDLREDRGRRQMKTKHHAKAFPHVR